MNDFLISIFQFVVFIFSVMVHEVAHGITAYKLGDDTAEKEGRLNLNPVNHIDPFGSIFLPLMLFLTGSPILFGWAKPVPFNPYNLKNPEKDSALISLAGPLSNFSIAVIFGIFLRIINLLPLAGDFLIPLETFLNAIIFINLLLAVFNLVPIPPLDGSKLLFAILPHRFHKFRQFMEENGMWILIAFLLFGIPMIQPIIAVLYLMIAG